MCERKQVEPFTVPTVVNIFHSQQNMHKIRAHISIYYSVLNLKWIIFQFIFRRYELKRVLQFWLRIEVHQVCWPLDISLNSRTRSWSWTQYTLLKSMSFLPCNIFYTHLFYSSPATNLFFLANTHIHTGTWINILTFLLKTEKQKLQIFRRLLIKFC